MNRLDKRKTYRWKLARVENHHMEMNLERSSAWILVLGGHFRLLSFTQFYGVYCINARIEISWISPAQRPAVLRRGSEDCANQRILVCKAVLF